MSDINNVLKKLNKKSVSEVDIAELEIAVNKKLIAIDEMLLILKAVTALKDTQITELEEQNKRSALKLKSLKTILKNSAFSTLKHYLENTLKITASDDIQLKFLKLINFIRQSVQYTEYFYKYTAKDSSKSKVDMIKNNEVKINTQSVEALNFMFNRIETAKLALEKDFNLKFNSKASEKNSVYIDLRNETAKSS